MDEPAEAVTLDGVWKVYGDGERAVVALRDVTVGFSRSVLTAVMGPSGSGKTTLLQCAAGLAEPTEGEVRIGGTSLSGVPERRLAVLRRQRVGFVFQDFNLLPALTGRENVVLPVRLDGGKEDPEWLEAVVARTSMAAHLDRFPHELSGGEQQRVAVCRALVARPEVVFADEPTGALDTRTGAEILGLLRQAVDELGQTVVMVTHEPVAAAYADRVLFLRDGRLIDRMERPTVRLVTQRLVELDRRLG